MKLETTADGRYLIYRDVGYRRQYFSMYVDHNKTSWSFLAGIAAHYATEEAAIDAMARINERRRLRFKK